MKRESENSFFILAILSSKKSEKSLARSERSVLVGTPVEDFLYRTWFKDFQRDLGFEALAAIRFVRYEHLALETNFHTGLH